MISFLVGNQHYVVSGDFNRGFLERYPVLQYLIKADMQGLYHFVKYRGYQELYKGYLSKCHLCLDIRKFLANNNGFEELKPGDFYKQVTAYFDSVRRVKHLV